MTSYRVSLLLAAASVATSVMAAPTVYDLSLGSIGTFNTAVAGTGATLITAQVHASQNVYSYQDQNGNNATVTVTRTSTGFGSNLPSLINGNPYVDNGVFLSGATWDISPTAGTAGGGAKGKPDIDGYGSGLTFVFSSPVNAFGLEIGDWATCCFNNSNRSAAVCAFMISDYS